MKQLTSPGRNGRPRAMTEPPATIRVTRRFSAPPERVFDAFLEPEVAGRWLFATALRPMTDVAIDARVGGSFRFAARRDDEIIEHRGEYIEIVPHRRLVFTLATTDRPRAVTRVTVEITPRKSGCELALTHERMPSDYANHAEGRWTGILYGLEATLGPRARRGSADSERSAGK